jgi:hypothetical protein
MRKIKRALAFASSIGARASRAVQGDRPTVNPSWNWNCSNCRYPAASA